MSTQEYYRKRADDYEAIYHRDQPSRQKEQTAIATTLKDIFQGRTVLEVACGTGYWTQFVADTAKQVIATDVVNEVIAIAQTSKQFSAPTLFTLADAFALPFKPATFDGGVANFWFSHLKKNQRTDFLDQFHDALQPGAQVFLADNVFNEGVGGELLQPVGEEDTYKLRTLKDGSQSLIVKNYPTQEELASVFGEYALHFGTENANFGQHFWFVSYTYKG